MVKVSWAQRAWRVGVMAGVSAMAAGCSQSSDPPRASVSRPAFTEAEYGVRSSPRVATSRGPLPRGGGHYKLGSPYNVAGQWYVPREDSQYDRQGVGSWYGDDFHGRRTSNGEIFDKNALTAAHPTLPLPSYVYVTNLQNGRTVLVRVNDRGPYVGGRIIDMSHAAATALGYIGQGRARVRVRYAGRAPLNGDDRRERQYLAQRGQNLGQSYGAAPVVALRRPSAPLSEPDRYAASETRGWSPTAYRAGLSGKP